MAENKKSFILYTDLIHTVAKMPPLKQAKLFMTILEYVNDKNPVVKDLIVGLVFEPIRQQLKRDLIVWEGIRENRSVSGKAGGIKSGESRRNKKEANEASALNNEAKRSKTKQNEANEAVNGNVTVNVNGNGSSSKINEDGRVKPLYELLKKVCVGYDNQFLEHQANKFLIKYPMAIVAQSGGLVNSWAARLNKEEQTKWKQSVKEQVKQPIKPTINYDNYMK